MFGIDMAQVTSGYRSPLQGSFLFPSFFLPQIAFGADTKRAFSAIHQCGKELSF
jgi:hypothetical protein